MTDFEREHSELIDWLQSQLSEARKLPRDGEGLDGANAQAIQKTRVYKEFRIKLEALKEKHQAPSVVKTRTFSQTLQPTGT